MVFVACFGVTISVMFHFMFVHYTFSWFGLVSGHLLGNSCLLSICIFSIFNSGFDFGFLQFLFIAFLLLFAKIIFQRIKRRYRFHCNDSSV